MTERIWTGPTPRKNDRKLRAAIFLGQDGKCKCCGKKLNLSEWDLDHEVELADGGSNDESNLVAKCKKCHRAKTSQSQDHSITWPSLNPMNKRSSAAGNGIIVSPLPR